MGGLSRPLAVHAVAAVVAEAMTVVATVVSTSVAKSVAAVQEVGVSAGLRGGLSFPLAVGVGQSGDNSGVLVHDGLANGVGDDGAGANGEGSLAGIVDLGVEGGGAKDGGHLVDGSLQITVVTGNLVASDGNGDGGVGGNNVGL